jgi:AraC-like DNA-binding protein
MQIRNTIISVWFLGVHNGQIDHILRDYEMTLHSSAFHGPIFSKSSSHAGDYHGIGPVRLREDSVLSKFIQLLLPPDEAGRVLRGYYTDALHSTLLDRLAELRNADGPCDGRRLSPLPKWRLKRVCEFVDANIEERISLGALAQVAGVSRMYFAAQFREATGLRPHDYVIRRRINLAKALLAVPDRSIVDASLSVGFQTQAHFTTVFKRIEGITPHRWRELNYADPSVSN